MADPTLTDDMGLSISPEDLSQLEETLDVLIDSEALADIREADAAYPRTRSPAGSRPFELL